MTGHRPNSPNRINYWLYFQSTTKFRLQGEKWLLFKPTIATIYFEISSHRKKQLLLSSYYTLICIKQAFGSVWITFFHLIPLSIRIAIRTTTKTKENEERKKNHRLHSSLCLAFGVWLPHHTWRNARFGCNLCHACQIQIPNIFPICHCRRLALFLIKKNKYKSKLA